LTTALVADNTERFVQSVTAAERALAEAETLSEVVNVRDQAAAIQRLAATARYGLRFQNMAAAFKLRAERKAGQVLAGLERAAPVKDGHGAFAGRADAAGGATSAYTAALDQFGIAGRTGRRWQAIAAMDDDLFTQYLALVDEADESLEITSAGLFKLAKALETKPPKPLPVPDPEHVHEFVCRVCGSLAAL